MTVTSLNGRREDGRRQQRGDRTPPHNIEAEEATLGAGMLTTHALEWLLANLDEGDWWRPAHRTVYATMAQLARDGAPVDATTVTAALQHEGQLAEVGGAPAILHLLEQVPAPSNVGYYGRIVKHCARLRRIGDFAARVGQAAVEPGAEPERLLAVAQALLDELVRDGQQIGLRPPDLLEAVREQQRAKDAGHLATWGVRALDELCGDLLPGNLVLLAALTSMGKSSLAIQVAGHNADRAHVLYVTYEMTRADIAKHLLAGIANCSLAEAAAFVDADGLAPARDQHDALDLTVFDHQPDAAQLLHETRSLHARRPLALVVVDYLQKVPPVPGRRYGTREQEVAEVSSLLKTLATRCEVPVLAAAQLNRGAVGRRPGLADLRDSGCLTEDTTLLRADTGAPITFRQLLDEGWCGLSVWSLDEHRRLVAAPIINVFASGTKEVYALKLASGRTVKASGNHQFLAYGGWVALDTLTPGNRVAVPRSLPAPVGVGLGWSTYRLGLLAHLIGDGCVLPKQPVHYTSEDEANLVFVEAAATAEFGIAPRRVPQGNWQHTYLPAPFRLARGRRNPIVQWFHDLGIAGRRSYEKRLPDALYAASNAEIAVFLRHLWATDGRVAESTTSGNGLPALWYSSSSRALIDGVALLLARLGIHARIRCNRKAGYRPGWTLHIYGSQQIRRFCVEVGVHGARGARAAALAQEMMGKAANPNVDALPLKVWGLVKAEMRRQGVSGRALASMIGAAYNGDALYKTGPSRARLMRVANALDSDVLRAAASDDVLWDRVVSIEPLGLMPVYDATVKGTHNFIADGVVAHNSLEQDADQVLFLTKPSRDAVRADALLDKNRMGPIGERPLRWLPRQAMFADV